jgi:hypothetical protein
VKLPGDAILRPERFCRLSRTSLDLDSRLFILNSSFREAEIHWSAFEATKSVEDEASGIVAPLWRKIGS